jgi:hypothetical protein
MNLNVFIAHSNKFMQYTIWFAAFLRNRGLNPITMELTPNYGKPWSPPEKYNYLQNICETALIIATPDEEQDGKPIPRFDVTYEIGNLVATKKIIFLKEKTTNLPTGLNPVYVPFDLENPQECLGLLEKELESIFGNNIKKDKSFIDPAPKYKKDPVYNIEGKGFAPENPIEIQKEVKKIFLTKSKTEQQQIFKDIFNLLDEKDDEKRWVASMFIEEIIEYDSNLVSLNILLKMAEDKFFSVRSAAAVCFYALAEICPGKVPLDILYKLASINEDWYVNTPAIATFQTLSHIMPRAFDLLFDMATSYDNDEVESNMPKLIKVIENDPDLIDSDKILVMKRHKNPLVKRYISIIEEIKSKKIPKIRRYKYYPF